MKFLIVVCFAIATASAAEQVILRVHPEHNAAILKQEQDLSPDGSYVYAIETENGITQGAQGTLKNAGTEGEAEVAQGGWSYTSPEGEKVTAEFEADELGYRVRGSHIPVPPPIPPPILRAIQWIIDHPPPVRTAESGYYVQ